MSGEFETKYALATNAASSILQWLQCRCCPDATYPAGIVSSIYYDTRGWHGLREKMNGDYLKTKVRVRWYADIDDRRPQRDSYIEAKCKIGAARHKTRITTGLSGEWLEHVSLSDHRLLAIPGLLRQEGVAVPRPLYPTLQITYKRRRFLDPVTGARLCLDYDICAPKVNWQMLPRANPLPLKLVICELKGHLLELPRVFWQLAAMGCRKASVSKYLACYQAISRLAS